jgi:hypothetical protein
MGAAHALRGLNDCPLKAMLGEEPLASLLKPRETFTLQEAMIIARKPS